MSPAVAIGLVVVIAAFLGWWLWASRRRQRAGGEGAQPRDAWAALDHGVDPSEGDDEQGAEEPTESADDKPSARPEPDSGAG